MDCESFTSCQGRIIDSPYYRQYLRQILLWSLRRCWWTMCVYTMRNNKQIRRLLCVNRLKYGKLNPTLRGFHLALALWMVDTWNPLAMNSEHIENALPQTLARLDVLRTTVQSSLSILSTSYSSSNRSFRRSYCDTRLAGSDLEKWPFLYRHLTQETKYRGVPETV